jgi:hypothetical protein
MVCEQQQPRLEAAFFRIELLNGSKDIQEDLLDRILCLRLIAQDTSRDCEKAGGVPFKQDCQRISISALQVPCQGLIRKKPMS